VIQGGLFPGDLKSNPRFLENFVRLGMVSSGYHAQPDYQVIIGGEFSQAEDVFQLTHSV
jgi:hypothetical protein